MLCQKEGVGGGGLTNMTSGLLGHILRTRWRAGLCSLSSKVELAAAQSPYRFDHSHVIFR